MIAMGVLLILAGWWLLAAAMPPCPVPRARRLRVAGGGALALSLLLFVAAIGFEQGPVFWASALMLGALAVALVRALALPDATRAPHRGRTPR